MSEPIRWDASELVPIVDLLAGRWLLPILEVLDEGKLRRTVLSNRLAPVSDKVLTETLRRLEAARFVRRSAMLSVPIEVDYALTDLARSLWPVLGQLQQWIECSRP